MSSHGHLWTFIPFARHLLRPDAPPPSQLWTAPVPDSRHGKVLLTGRLSEPEAARAIVIIVHGLGGNGESYYAVAAAHAAERAGLSSLRLNLRGADELGEDFYHAGLTSDLAAAIASPTLSRYDDIYLLGYSLGGHMALRYLSEDPDPRIRAAAAVCSPIDLEASAQAIDQPARAVYRHNVLRALKRIYRQVASRKEVPVSVGEAMAISTIHQWDELVVAPRHGFDSARDYWEKMSVWSRLTHIKTPTLFVAAEYDPMVLIDTVRPRIPQTDNLTTVITARGGHVGFPPDLDLGVGATGSIADQALHWMMAAEPGSRRLAL